MPSAPASIFTPPATPTPSAAGAVHAVPSASPGAIGAVHAVPVVGGGGGLIGVTIAGVDPAEANGYYDLTVWDGSSTLYNVLNGLGGVLEYSAFNGRWSVIKDGTGQGMQSTFATAFSASPGVAVWESVSGGVTGTAVDNFSSALPAPTAIHASPGVATPPAPPVIFTP